MELKTESQSAPIPVPQMIEDAYYAGLKRTGRAVWRGMTMVGASGFGKAALLALGVVTLGGAIASAAVGTGFLTGAVSAFWLMAGTLKGWAVLAAVGTLGAVNDVRKEQNLVRAQIAKAQEQDYELSRQLQQAKQVQPAALAPEIPECDHCARELARRANPTEPTKAL